ncbi:MAG: tRNA (N6-threonylcarbamoyladenosine(37)-N6)-methyltransferase TrmO [Gammaproteobacteria bacterium]|nr:tRNA (N6-threonylcarbamoyladenosine(37)-N6)-methyltransferase TrmO [Gammaproteobacteria bacterium]
MTVGIVHSPFKEKFGIPRQPGLVPQAAGILELLPPYNCPESVSGLADYSHIWIQFWFHQVEQGAWQPRVRPPRLGGNRRVGVFASRSPFRPNPIGLSVVKLNEVRCEGGAVTLAISGIDILDGTPVLDIKPYVSYADSIPDARSGFAPTAPDEALRVVFSAHAERQIQSRGDLPKLRELIVSLLTTDPRPAYVEDGRKERVYGIHLYDFDLRWRVENREALVLELLLR